MIRAVAIGWRAHDALRASAGRVRVVAALSRSLYAEANGEMLWLGGPGTPMHARAVLALDVPAARPGAPLEVLAGDLMAWRPDAVTLDRPRTRAGGRALRASLHMVGTARGLGRLLVPGHDDAVTARARPHAVALGEASARDDARGVAEAGRALLGLGGGLTPSGDDYVGGALFALRVLGNGGPAWAAATTALLDDARARSHPISARLLADLAAGEGWAPLHALAAALGAQGPAAIGGDNFELDRARSAAIAAARALVALGHSSGWDLLAGVLAALLGTDAFPTGTVVETGPL